jgi:DNA primase
MRLYLDDNQYYCFGCAARGDVIQWVRDAERLALAGAIGHLDSGQPITNTWAGRPYRHSPEAQRRDTSWKPGRTEPPDLSRTSAERVSEALQTAWAHYSSPTLHRKGAAYLARRGIDIGVLEDRTGRCQVGHTPADPAGLTTALRASGYSDEELVDAGLALRYAEGGPVSDYYRDRALIALQGDDGGVAGMIGRNIGDGRWPKYKNPPRTHAYDKSVNLYQPLPAPARPDGQVVVVEGTLDALAIACMAIRAGEADAFCPVTQSGRELSETQMSRILSLHPTPPVLGFDADAAGADSAARYAAAFSRLGVAVYTSVLGTGHDPATWLSELGPRGLSAWSRHRPTDPSWDGPRPSVALRHLAGRASTADPARPERPIKFGHRAGSESPSEGLAPVVVEL